MSLIRPITTLFLSRLGGSCLLTQSLQQFPQPAKVTRLVAVGPPGRLRRRFYPRPFCARIPAPINSRFAYHTLIIYTSNQNQDFMNPNPLKASRYLVNRLTRHKMKDINFYASMMPRGRIINVVIRSGEFYINSTTKLSPMLTTPAVPRVESPGVAARPFPEFLSAPCPSRSCSLSS